MDNHLPDFYIPINFGENSPVQALTTTRRKGASRGVFQGLNLADHVGDDLAIVKQNRAQLVQQLRLPGEPKWLKQTHSTHIVQADKITAGCTADGSFTSATNCICAVMTADCLPVFIANPSGACIGVFHAGWRGLANGILANAVAAMRRYSDNLVAALGPAISQDSFEVGPEVHQVFVCANPAAARYFRSSTRANHYFADLYNLARLELNRMGIDNVQIPGSVCTFRDKDRYYSYRRDGQCGRMASLIWINR